MPELLDRCLLQVEGCSKTLRVVSVAGTEAISRLFRFQVEFTTDDPSLTFDDFVGKAASLTFLTDEGTPRYVHGIIGRMSLGRFGKKVQYGRFEIVPKVW